MIVTGDSDQCSNLEWGEATRISRRSNTFEEGMNNYFPSYL